MYMGNLRAEFRTKQVLADSGGTIEVTYSMWPFVLTSLFLVFLAIGIHFFFFPSKEEWKAMEDHQRLQTELEANKSAEQQYEDEINTLKEDHEALKAYNKSKLTWGANMEGHIILEAHRGFEKYKHESLPRRPDKGRPLSFDIEGYPCVFETRFDIINKVQL